MRFLFDICAQTTSSSHAAGRFKQRKSGFGKCGWWWVPGCFHSRPSSSLLPFDNSLNSLHSTPLSHFLVFLHFLFVSILSHTLCFSLCLSFSLFHATTSQRRTKTTIRCLSESQRWIAKMLTTNVKRSSRIFHSRHRAAIRRAWKYYTPR